MRILIYLSAFLIPLFVACKNDDDKNKQPNSQSEPKKYVDSVALDKGIPIDKINLPDGFGIMLFADDIPNARSLRVTESGWIFVGSRGAGNVYAIRDNDGDYRIDEKIVLASGLSQPNGVAVKDGDLYVAEISRIIKFEGAVNNPQENMNYTVINDDYPTDKHHGWKYIDFGPDGKLYVPVGAPCNICEPDSIYASITRMNADGSDREIVQHGIRNTVGFTWHPETKELWFTDNGRDHLGDNEPACELNHAPRENMHFGYPYCHEGDLPDPEYGQGVDCSQYEPPVQGLGPHVAPLGLEFYTGSSFGSGYQNQVFIAEHGSWNRTVPIGYRVTLVTLDENYESTGYEIFAEGWLNKETEEKWGRPVDIELLPDGSMLVSDDHGGRVFRIFRL